MSTPNIERIVNSRVFSQLCELWSATAKMAGESGLLITEEVLLDSAPNNQETNLKQKLASFKFHLLITPSLQALLQGAVVEENKDYYQVTIIFDPPAIKNHLSQLSQQNQANETVIENLQSSITQQLTDRLAFLSQFFLKAIALLITDKTQINPPLSCSILPVDKLLHEQMKQQHILDRNSYHQLEQQKSFLEQQVKTQAQQIKDALIAAEAASQSKHQFIGSMSHELRTPLTRIIGLADTLLQWSLADKRTVLPIEKQRQYLGLIHDSGKQLLSLINKILEFSEVESGKHLLDIRQVSLQKIALQTLELVTQAAQDKQITLNFDFKLEGKDDEFFADPERLQEILFNLLNNAIKFSLTQSEVILRIWRENHQVIFQVEDNGIGIAESEIPLLFEKFKQLEDFRRRTHGGTGLGLALTKQLIELHGGGIEVESELNKGSIFTFYLPEQIHQSPQVIPSASEQLAENVTTSSPTIMLVTEDEENATLIWQLLTAVGYQVVWLMDATLAEDYLKLLSPNLAIIDRDCAEVAVNIVDYYQAQTITEARLKVILLYPHLKDDDWQYFAQRGIHEYLLKSMTPTTIIERVSKVIEESLSTSPNEANQHATSRNQVISHKNC